jgi:hypothetical protein
VPNTAPALNPAIDAFRTPLTVPTHHPGGVVAGEVGVLPAPTMICVPDALVERKRPRIVHEAFALNWNALTGRVDVLRRAV